jgi:hypothetical protein
MGPIRYANRTVAICAGDDVLPAPEIAALEPDHRTRRFVSMLCVFSAEVDAGAEPDGVRGYSSAAAERYARRELIPDELFGPLAHRADHELARSLRHPARADRKEAPRPGGHLSRSPVRVTPAARARAATAFGRQQQAGSRNLARWAAAELRSQKLGHRRAKAPRAERGPPAGSSCRTRSDELQRSVAAGPCDPLAQPPQSDRSAELAERLGGRVTAGGVGPGGQVGGGQLGVT